jgi:hypothetical protein
MQMASHSPMHHLQDSVSMWPAALLLSVVLLLLFAGMLLPVCCPAAAGPTKPTGSLFDVDDEEPAAPSPQDSTAEVASGGWKCESSPSFRQ